VVPLVLLGAGSGPGAAGAGGTPFKATGSGTNALAACPAGFTLCFTTSGSFSEPRLGAGTFTALTKEQSTGACRDGSGIAGTATATIAATVPGGTLKLLLDATFCGAADFTATFDGTFTVTAGTGRLAGASGGGSFSGKASLVSEQITLAGTLLGVTEQLKVSLDPLGSVRSSPAGLYCPGTCTAEFLRGMEVTLTARPAEGAGFSRWDSKPQVCPEPTNAVCTFTLSDSRSVHAFFKARALTVRVSRQGPGRVTSSPAGISCPDTCQAQFPRATKVVLTATPASNAVFRRWSGQPACAASQPSCTLTLYSDSPVSAVFEYSFPERTLKVARSGQGSVRSEPAGISCPPTCEARFKERTDVRLMATPGSDYSFAGWLGRCSAAGFSSTCRLTISGDASVGASFKAVPKASLRVTVKGVGRVESAPRGIDCYLSCSASFRSYTTVTLTAKPRNGSKFDGWDGDACAGSKETVCAVRLDASKSVSARFVKP
jgi:hypothetical protein